MNTTTLKRYAMVAAVVLAVVAIAGCDMFGLPLTDSERLTAFLESANESSRDYVAMQSHYSESAPSYSSLNTSSFWEGTVFQLANQTFSVTGRTTGGEISGYPGSTSISGTFQSSGPTGVPIVFIFVPDSAMPNNRVLAAIDYNNGIDVIKNRVDN